jgi:hypothetical protein
MSESTQMANAFVRGANLNTSMMYVGSIMSSLVRAQDTDGRFAMVEYRAAGQDVHIRPELLKGNQHIWSDSRPNVTNEELMNCRAPKIVAGLLLIASADFEIAQQDRFPQPTSSRPSERNLPPGAQLVGDHQAAYAGRLRRRLYQRCSPRGVSVAAPDHRRRRCAVLLRNDPSDV